MTVATQAAIATFSYTGVETSFSAGFPAQDAAHVVVISQNPTTFAQTILTLGVNYSVTLAAGTDLVAVVPIALPLTPATIIVTRQTPGLQATDFANLSDFPPATYTSLFDAAALRSDEATRDFSRALLVPMGETTPGILPNASARANGGAGSIAGYDASGRPIALTLAAAGAAFGLVVGGWGVGVVPRAANAAGTLIESSRAIISDNGTLTLTPVPSSTAQGLMVNQSGLGGSNAGAIGPHGLGFAYNQVDIEGDTWAGLAPSPYTYGVNVVMTTGGAAAHGTKTAFQAFVLRTAAANGDGDTIAGTFYAEALAGDGGTDNGAGAKGTLFALNPKTTAGAGAAHLFMVSGAEVDVGINGGSSRYRMGWSVVDNGTTQAASLDAAYETGAIVGAPGFKFGHISSNLHGGAPYSADAVVFGTDGSAVTVTSVLDYSAYSATGYFLRGPGGKFSISGAGSNMTLGGVPFAETLGTVTPYNAIFDSAGNLAFIAGGAGSAPDATNYLENTRTVIGSIGNASTYATFATGATGVRFNQYGAGLIHSDSSGNLASYTLGATLAFVTGALQTAAHTGDVTTAANSFVTTVAKIAGVTVGTPTGTTNVVFSNSPTLVTPTLGVASATSINKVAFTAPATGSTLTIADGKTATHNATTTFAGVDGKTLTINNTLTLAGTDATTMTFPATSQTLAGLAVAQTFTAAQVIAVAAGLQLTVKSTGANNAYLFLDTSAAGQQSGFQLNDNGTAKWQFIKQSTSNTFLVFSNADGVVFQTFTPGGGVQFAPVTGVYIGTVADPGANNLAVAGIYKVGTNQVVGARVTGYVAMTGTPDKGSTFATASVTLAQLAGRVMQLQADLTTHGLIGA